MSATAATMLAKARSQIGYHEGWDPRTQSWNNDTIYGRWYGLNFNPWCAMFISWCAYQVTIPTSVIPKFAYCPTGVNFFRNARRWGAKPQVGAIVFYSWSGLRAEHVGIVEAVRADGSIVTIEGNTNTSGSPQGDGVYRMVRKANIMGYGYPAYTAPPPPPPPHTTQVSLAQITRAAMVDPRAPQGHKTYPVPVMIVEKALAAEHLLSWNYVDGSFGTYTVSAYAAWQRRLGYKGADANGIPGKVSLAKLGARHGFTVVA